MRTLIFDFDGTIADSFATFVEVFEEVTKRKDKITDAQLEQLRGLGVRDIMKLLGIKRRQIPRLLIRGRSSMAQRIQQVSPIPGLPAVIRDLHRQGYKMLILSTNSPDNINVFLKKNKLDSYFEDVGSTGLNKAKGLRKILKKHNLNKSECVYIGDEVRDIEAGAKAKLDVISAGWGYNTPESLERAKPLALAKKPRHLPQIIRQLDS